MNILKIEALLVHPERDKSKLPLKFAMQQVAMARILSGEIKFITIEGKKFLLKEAKE